MVYQTACNHQELSLQHQIQHPGRHSRVPLSLTEQHFHTAHHYSSYKQPHMVSHSSCKNIAECRMVGWSQSCICIEQHLEFHLVPLANLLLLVCTYRQQFSSPTLLVSYRLTLEFST